MNRAEINAIENSLNGLLFTATDEKVRRWALNALAQLVGPHSSIQGLEYALDRYGEELQTAASAIAALFSIRNDAQTLLSKRDTFSRDLIVLAALQRAPVSAIDTSQTRINIESAPPDILRLALIIVGLRRVPEHIFHPRHANAKIVKVLGGHHDVIVSQYSIWAISENPDLGMRDLGVDLRDIESQPPNVRSWMLRLVAMSGEVAPLFWELFRLGAGDQTPEVRLGLAIGLRDTYVDGMEPMVLNWYFVEGDAEVRSHILDHMVKHASRSPSYEDVVLQLYKQEPPNSSLRTRMEALASRTRIFGEFKKIASIGPDLFNISDGKELILMNNPTINIQGGAVSLGGAASNTGQVQNTYNVETIQALQRELSSAKDLINSIKMDETLKFEVNTAISNAQADPTPEKIGVVKIVLGKARGALKSLASAAGDAIKITELINKLGSLAG